MREKQTQFKPNTKPISERPKWIWAIVNIGRKVKRQKGKKNYESFGLAQDRLGLHNGKKTILLKIFEQRSTKANRIGLSAGGTPMPHMAVRPLPARLSPLYLSSAAAVIWEPSPGGVAYDASQREELVPLPRTAHNSIPS